jgi:hypothetical protein
LALRSRVIHCLAFRFAQYNGTGELNDNDLHKKDPGENHGAPFDDILRKKRIGEKDVDMKRN